MFINPLDFKGYKHGLCESGPLIVLMSIVALNSAKALLPTPRRTSFFQPVSKAIVLVALTVAKFV